MKKIRKIIFENPIVSAGLMGNGAFLVAASMMANFGNFFYNIYLARTNVISLQEFGVISLIGSFLNLAQIPLSSYSRAIVHETAYYFGKTGIPAAFFWRKLRNLSIFPSIVLSTLWIVASPFLSSFFHTKEMLPFLLLTPLWLVGIMDSVDSGFLSGSHKFFILGLMTIVEVFVKLAATILLVQLGAGDWFYLSIPISAVVSFAIGWFAAVRLAGTVKKTIRHAKIAISRRFFVSSLMTKLSAVIFLNLDVILAKHYLSPNDAGSYAILSLVGKIVYFLGVLFAQFLNPIVSKQEGEGKSSRSIFIFIMGLTLAFVFVSWVIFGVFGKWSLAFLLREKGQIIVPYLSLYTLAMGALALGSGVVSYYQSKERHSYAIINFGLSLLMIVGIIMYHSSIRDIALVVSFTGIISFLGTLFVYTFHQPVHTVLSNLEDIFEAFFSFKQEKSSGYHPRSILILNWRDTKHVWGGGSELYLHELSKRLVKFGYHVTMFCGNDEKSPRNEVIDGVQVVRRGGFYTVYFWAALYYLLRFRGKYDCIIDTENGIPFFSPLYAGVPVILAIHHVHQDVFRTHLRFPFSYIAMFLERRIMPSVYAKSEVITVSKSSKEEIIKNRLAKNEQITVIEPGITMPTTLEYKKTPYPSVVYLGRLKSYKNIDVLVKAFSQLKRSIPSAHLTIAGYGEERTNLEILVRTLGLGSSVTFRGRVSEEQKYEILGKSWIAVQPSSVEGWGMTVIEANAVGTPVIGSRVNGLKDSIVHRKTGLLVMPRHVEALRSALYHTLKESTYRRELQSNARTWAKAFHWEERVQVLISLFMKYESIDIQGEESSRVPNYPAVEQSNI